ncbi:vWA domain-containing protein [Oceanibaculum nanhaiense]|uniref:vWA domain-containing protein n=1 Tax=Oceanibaculum nanhaiense TaxID=1909734 RepID=UPI003F7295E7
MANINSVLCIDTSGSMSSPSGSTTSLGAAKHDASMFALFQHQTAELGMVSFNTTATTGFTLQTMSLSNKLLLSHKLYALSATGLTNIQDALNKASALLTNSQASNSIVLLTDGYANQGTVPPVKPTNSPPIYAIGLGNSVNTTDLQNLASTTGGHYYHTPGVQTLMQMYNDIVAQAGMGAVLTNTQGSVGTSGLSATTSVSSGAGPIRIGVAWDNQALTYTSGTPSTNQISLSVHCPTGTSLPATPTAQGAGFVVYEISSPGAGTYSSLVTCNPQSSTSATIGAVDTSLTTSFAYSAPATAPLGKSIVVPCHVADADGSTVSGWSMSGFVDSPSIDPQEVIARNRAALDALDMGDIPPEEVNDNQRLLLLDAQRGPDQPLLPRHRAPVEIAHGPGENRVSFTPQTRGVHIVTVKAVGHAPAAGREFSLVRVMTILVE